MRLLVPKLLLGAALCAGLATVNADPAAAADREIGAVNVSAADFTDVRWSRFGGPLDHFSFMPVNDSVTCEHVTIHYRDGITHEVFKGYIAEGARTTISLPPPNDGRVRDVTFACKAEKMDGARIALSATTDSWERGWETADLDRPARLETQTRAE